MAGMLVFEQGAVRVIEGSLRVYESSPGVERGFCDRCGTSLTWKGRGLVSIHIGTLDDPDGFPPTGHWRWEERSPWIAGAFDLPHVTMAYP